MEKNKKKEGLLEKITAILVFYAIGVLLGIIFYFLKALRRIKVVNRKNFPHNHENLIVVSNHPSLLEPILLPCLFFREYIFHPLKFSPWSTPDKKNYYDQWYWFWLRPRAIPIDRNDTRGEIKAFFLMKEVLKSGGILILFPEGGRTYKGEEFLLSQGGKRIRLFQDGVGHLVLKTNCRILPIWVEGTDKVIPNSNDRFYVFPRFWNSKIIIKIGKTMSFDDVSNRKMIVQKIMTALLELADQEE